MSRARPHHVQPGHLPWSADDSRAALLGRDLLLLLASGMSIEAILEDHPDLERNDLLAALEFGALAVGQRRGVHFDST